MSSHNSGSATKDAYTIIFIVGALLGLLTTSLLFLILQAQGEFSERQAKQDTGNSVDFEERIIGLNTELSRQNTELEAMQSLNLDLTLALERAKRSDDQHAAADELFALRLEKTELLRRINQNDQLLLALMELVGDQQTEVKTPNHTLDINSGTDKENTELATLLSTLIRLNLNLDQSLSAIETQPIQANEGYTRSLVASLENLEIARRRLIHIIEVVRQQSN